MPNKKAGLYIHIPFCLSKCAYCSFYSIRSMNLIDKYIPALKREIEFYGDTFDTFDTVYLGGGTPSLLTAGQLANIFSAIHKTYKIDRCAEITIEVNPGDILSVKYLQELRSLGINRINIGVQSFAEDILKILGRRHSAADAITAIELARRAGFANIGLDLIYGIYNQDLTLWKHTLQKAISFVPEHLSCYQLSLSPRTILYKNYQANGFSLPKEKTQVEIFKATSELLRAAGYIHYEISNFARKDDLKSRHNMKYWDHTPYLGLGPAAHSFLNNERWWNKSAVKSYLRDITADKKPVENREDLSIEQIQLETLFLGLRTKTGIDLNLYKVRYGSDLLAEKKNNY